MAARGIKPGVPHWHGCKRCHDSYEDTCQDTKTNGLCVVCRRGRGFQLLIEARRPWRICCRTKSKLATKENRQEYRLAGDALWFQCAECKRAHPFDDPTKTQITTQESA